jgi:hypothetical protein
MLQLVDQPSLGMFPLPPYSPRGDTQHLSRLFLAQSAEEAQFDHAGLTRVGFRQDIQCVVQGDGEAALPGLRPADL